MGRYKDKHGYTRLSHWLGLDGANPFEVFQNQFGLNLNEMVRSLLANWTGESLTGAQREANDFSAQQAQLNRDFQQEMSSTAYQRQVSDMQNAGVNPALALGGTAAGASTPSGNAAASAALSPVMSMSDIMQVAMLPAQMRMLDQQVKGAELENAEREIDLSFLEQEKITALNYTAAQISDIQDMIKTREVERALKQSNISVNEANEALSIQQALATAIDNKTRDELNQALLAYRAAETAYTEQKTDESKKNMDVMSAQVSELYARAIMEGAQTNVFTQQEKNMLVEHGILEWNEKEHAFTVDHQKADRTWRIVDSVVGDVTKVVGAAGTFVGGLGLGALRGAKSRSEGSGLYLPTGMNAFGEHYRINR